MRKKILSIVLLLATILSFTGCNSNTDSSATINIASLKGPTSIGLAKLYKDSDNGLTDNDYNYSIHGTADEITAGLSKGEIDIAAIPCNLASILHNKTEGEILIAGINTLGVIYVVSKGVEINSIDDLKGHTIYSTGQGTTPEYTFNYIVESHGLNPKEDMTIQYYSEAGEIASLLANKDKAIAVLPQPFVTTVLNSNPDVTLSLDLTKEWEKINKDSTVVTGVIVVRKEFVNDNAEAFKTFIDEYRQSVDFANNNTSDCATIIEELDIMKAAIATKAIPYCNVVLITGEEMEQKVTSYLTVLHNANPQAVGGKLPDTSIFYK